MESCNNSSESEAHDQERFRYRVPYTQSKRKCTYTAAHHHS